MPESAEVAADDWIEAEQYNDLRKDVLSETLGHLHSGSADGGRSIASILAQILTVDGDILIRSGGVVTKLTIGDENDFLRVISGLPAWGDIVVPDAAAGDVPVFANDVGNNTNSVTYVKMMEIVVPKGGEWRIKFRLSRDVGTAYGRIYRNGVAVGTERTRSDDGNETFTEDIAGWTVNDFCQLYGHSSNVAYYASVGEFRLYNA